MKGPNTLNARHIRVRRMRPIVSDRSKGRGARVEARAYRAARLIKHPELALSSASERRGGTA